MKVPFYMRFLLSSLPLNGLELSLLINVIKRLLTVERKVCRRAQETRISLSKLSHLTLRNKLQTYITVSFYISIILY